MATTQAVRRWIMTGAVAAVTITGTIYGATLKEDLGVTRVCHRLFLPSCTWSGSYLDVGYPMDHCAIRPTRVHY
jgi:hypothetical protein